MNKNIKIYKYKLEQVKTEIEAKTIKNKVLKYFS